MMTLRPTLFLVTVGLLLAMAESSAALERRVPSPEPRTAVVVALLAQATQPPTQQDEFVPIDQLPPQDQLPAAPLLIAAYAFVMLALFAYVVSVARGLAAVQKELTRLESDVKRGRRP